ncbi:MAG: FG-GAP repeat domain-containing protein [Polyangiales bacterium]
MKASWRVGALVVLGLLASCSDTTIGLSINVRTDLSPGNEFQRVVASLVGEGVEQELGSSGDFIEGVRVADFEDLEPSESRTVRIDLLDAAGALVLRGEVLVNHREDRGLVVVMTRDCREVSCAEATTCRGGGCVALDCVDGTQPSCPEPECRREVDCPAADACSVAQCAEGVCLYAPLTGACSVDEYCDPDRGCLAMMTLADAGPMDAGVDATDDLDAGFDTGSDTGPMELGVPRPTWPPNGSYTGAWNRSPRFNWEPVERATRYQIQVDNSCDRNPAVPCDFPSPEVWVVLTVLLEHVLTEPIIPQDAPGQRVRWRVRACIELDCGAWSRERYLELGISELDVDGDARPDLVVGTEANLTRMTIEGGGLVPTVQQMFASNAVIALERGDFNADGLSDVLKIERNGVGSQGISVHAGSLGGLVNGVPITAPRRVGDISNVTCSADFDADGYRDVAIQDTTTSYVFWGSPSGLEATPTVLVGLFSTCGDVDHDGYADMVLDDRMVTAGYYSGAGMRAAAPAIRDLDGLLPFQLMGDVNVDGYQDAIMRGPDTALLVLGNGNGFDSPVELDVGLNSGSHVQMVDIGNTDRFGAGHGRNAVWADESFLGERPDMSAGFGGIAFQSGASPTFLHGPCDCDGLGMEVRFGMDLNGDTFGDIAVAHEDGVYFFFGQPGGYNTVERTYEHGGAVRGTSL